MQTHTHVSKYGFGLIPYMIFMGLLRCPETRGDQSVLGNETWNTVCVRVRAGSGGEGAWKDGARGCFH